MKSKVDGYNNLYKDTETGVIVNRESTERQRYRLAKNQATITSNTVHELAHLKGEID